MALDGLHRLADAIKKTPEAIATEAKINEVLEKLKKLQDTVVTDDELKQIKEDLKDAYLKASISAKNAIDDALLAIKKEKDATAKAIKADIQESADNVTLAYMDLEASYETTKKETQMMMEEKLTAFGEFAGEKINAAAQFIGTKTKEAINGALDYVASKISMISTNLSALTGAVKAGFNKLKGWIMNPIETLKALPGQIIAGIGTLLNKVKQAVVWTVKAAYSLIVGAVKYTMLAAVKVLKFAIWAVGKAVQFGFYLMKQAFAFMFKIVSKVFSFVVGVMWGAIKAMGKFLLTFVWESLKVIGKTVLKIGAFIFKMVIQIFTSMLASALGPIILLLGGILLFVLIASGKLKGLWDGIKKFFGFGDDGKVSETVAKESVFFRWINGIWEDFKGWLVKIWNRSSDVGKAIWGFFDNLLTGVGGFFTRLFNKTTDIGGKFWNLLKDFGGWLGRVIMGENVVDSIDRLQANRKKEQEKEAELKAKIQTFDDEVKKIRDTYKTMDISDPNYEISKKEMAQKLREIWVTQDALQEELKTIPAQIESIDTELQASQRLLEEKGSSAQNPGFIQKWMGGNFTNLSLSAMFSVILLGNETWVWSNPPKDSVLGRVIHYFETAYEWMKINIFQPVWAFLSDILFKITSAIIGGGEYIIDTLINLLAKVLRAVDKPEWADQLTGFAEKGRNAGTAVVAKTRDLKLDAEQKVTESKQDQAYKQAQKRYSEYLSSPEYHKYDTLGNMQQTVARANFDAFLDEEMKSLGVTSGDANKKQHLGVVEYGLNTLFKSRVSQLGFLNKDLSLDGINGIIKNAKRNLSVMGFNSDIKEIGAFHQLDSQSALYPDNASINAAIALLSKFTDTENVRSYETLATIVSQDGKFMEESEKKWKVPYTEHFDTSLGKAGEFGGGKRTKVRDGTFVGNLIEQKEEEYNPGFFKWLSNQAWWLLPLGAALAAAAITVGTAGIGAPIAGTLLATVSAMGTAGVAGAKIGSAVTSGSYAESLIKEFAANQLADPFASTAPLKFASGGIIKPPSANGGRMITVAEAGDPEIVVPLNAQGLKYIQEVSDRIQPVESSGGMNSSNEGILKALQDISSSMNNSHNKKIPMMPALGFSNSDKMDVAKLISMGILSK